MGSKFVTALVVTAIGTWCVAATPPVEGLTCTIADGVGYLQWTNAGAYDGIRVLIDGATAPGSPIVGSATNYRSDSRWYAIPVADPRSAWYRVSAGSHTFSVQPYLGTDNATTVACAAVAPAAPAGVTCTVNVDGSVSLAWAPGAWNSIVIVRDGVDVVTLAGTAAAYTDATPGWLEDYDTKVYGVRGVNAAGSLASAWCAAGRLADGYYAFQDGVIEGAVTAGSGINDVAQDANSGMFVGYGSDLRTWNNGGGFYMEEGDQVGTGHADLKDLFLKMRTTALSAGTTVAEARLELYYLYMRDVSPATTQPREHTLYARETLKDWNGGIVLSGAFGWGYQNGGPANAGEVTFNSARHAQLPWEIPGAYGDTDVAPPTMQSTVVFNPAVYNRWLTFDVTGLVQGCIDAAKPSLALKITQNGSASPPNPALDYVPGLYGFASSEYMEAYKRPRLIVRTLTAPAGLVCTADAATGDIELSWTNQGASYDAIKIVRNGVVVTEILDGTAETFGETVPLPGVYAYQVSAIAAGKESGSLTCTVGVVPPVKNLEGFIGDGVAYLAWENGPGVTTGIEVLLDAVPAPASPLAGTATGYASDARWYAIPVANPSTWFKVGAGAHTFCVTPYVIVGGVTYTADSMPGTAVAPSPPTGVVCTRNVLDDSVSVTWDVPGGAAYARLQIYRDGELIADSEPAAGVEVLQLTDGSYTDSAPGWTLGYEQREYTVRGIEAGGSYASAACVARRLSDGFLAFQEGVINAASQDPLLVQDIVQDANGGMFVGWGQDLGNWNNGGGFYMEEGDLRGVGHTDLKDIFLRIDMNAIPSGTLVVEARLGLWYRYMRDVLPVTTAPQPHTLYARKTLKAWTGGIVVSNAFGWGYQNGGPANPGEVTFKSAQHGSLPWEIAGAYGDTDVAPPSAQATTAFDPAEYDAWVTFNVTDLVRACVDDGGAPREDFAVKITQNGTANAPDPTFDYVAGLYGFATSEIDAAAKRPLLVVRTLVAPTSLVCTVAPDTWNVSLAWQNHGSPYDTLTILRNGTIIADGLAGDTTAFAETVPRPGVHAYEVVARAEDLVSSAAAGDVAVTYVPPVAIVSCSIDATGVGHLAWTNGSTIYDGITLTVDGVAQSPVLAGDATGAGTTLLAAGSHTFALTPFIVEGGTTYEAVAQVCGGVALPGAPSDLACVPAAGSFDVLLAWTNAAAYQGVTILRDGVLVQTLNGALETYADTVPAPGSYMYAVFGTLNAVASEASTPCSTLVSWVPAVTPTACSIDADRVAHLAWTNGHDAYTAIVVTVDGTPTTLPGTTTRFDSAPLDPGVHNFAVRPAIGVFEGVTTTCSAEAPLPPPANLSATAFPDAWTVNLAWSNGWAYDRVTILRDGVQIQTLGGAPATFSDTVPGPGSYVYSVSGSLGSLNSTLAQSGAAVVTFVPPVAIVACTIGADRTATLAWAHGATYTALELRVDGVPVDPALNPTAETSTSAPLAPGTHTFVLVPAIGAYTGDAATCSAEAPLPPPVNLSATAVADAWTVNLAWSNGWAYDHVTILRDGTPIATLTDSPASTTYVTTVVGPKRYTFGVYGALAGQPSEPVSCEADVTYVPAPAITACAIDQLGIARLAWANAGPYTAIELLIDGAPAPGSPLAGTATSYVATEPLPTTNLHAFELTPLMGTYRGASARCADDPTIPRFLRADTNSDRQIDLGDVIFLLVYLFREGTSPSCLETANSNDDDAVDIADAIHVLNYLFRSGVPPRMPFPACDKDPFPEDSLGCASYPSCAQR